MKKIIFYGFFVLILLVLGGPRWIDAVQLKFFASPEEVLNRFYTEKDLAEDQLQDSLIMAGPKMAPLLEQEILKKDIPRRRYAIGALSNIGDHGSIPALEQILQDKSEMEYFRVDALESIALIDLSYAQSIAPQYQKDTAHVARCANIVLTAPERLYQRSHEEAFWHRHD